MPGLKTGVENEIFWSEIGSGFVEPGGTPLSKIPRSAPPPPPVTTSGVVFLSEKFRAARQSRERLKIIVHVSLGRGYTRERQQTKTKFAKN